MSSRDFRESEAMLKKQVAVTITAAFLTLANSLEAFAVPVSPLDGADGASALTLVQYRNNGRPDGGPGPRPGPGGGYQGRLGGPHGHPGYGPHRPGGPHGWHGGPHYRPGGYYGGWRRPYRWSPGGAIAAGAAIGFMAGAAAGSYAATAAPAPGLCWYYTDASRRAGFWDSCPR